MTAQELEQWLSGQTLDPALRSALLGSDRDELERLLGATANICCMVHSPEDDEEETEHDDDDFEDDDDEEGEPDSGAKKP